MKKLVWIVLILILGFLLFPHVFERIQQQSEEIINESQVSHHYTVLLTKYKTLQKQVTQLQKQLEAKKNQSLEKAKEIKAKIESTETAIEETRRTIEEFQKATRKLHNIFTPRKDNLPIEEKQ